MNSEPISSEQELLDKFDDDYSPMVAVAKKMGIAAFDELLAELGGTKPHIPMMDNFWATLEREVRNEEIREKFHGNNYDQLQLEYLLGERQIRAIVHQEKRSYQPSKTSSTIKISNENHERLELLATDFNVGLREITDTVMGIAIDSREVMAELRKQVSVQLVLPVEEAA